MLINANKEIQRVKSAEDKVVDRITGFAGSIHFVYIHSIWFALWILVNLGLLGASLIFDKYPFGLLTLIVSLEAIFLSTFVMISQNRQAKAADIRSELDYQVNVKAEKEVDLVLKAAPSRHRPPNGRPAAETTNASCRAQPAAVSAWRPNLGPVHRPRPPRTSLRARAREAPPTAR